ncbi:MAG: flavin reductase family protein [Steroidobacteraceae bacterium]|nr:flavin reductase family protein [Steroidobacteraceae bacterium]
MTARAPDRPATPEPALLRRAFGLFATGVTIVTGIKADGAPAGITVNSFTSVSLTPPLLLWCLQNESTSRDAFGAGQPFAVHVLGIGQQRDAMHFARRASGKFPAGGTPRGGVPLRIDGALCRLEGRVEALHPGGDHTIVVGRIARCEIRGGEPLVFHGGLFGRFVAEPRARHVEAWETFDGDWF